MSYNKMKLSVGIFMLIFFIFVGGFMYLLLKEKGTFEKRYNYHFSTLSANSFHVGMPLKFSGFNIGVIDKIALKDDGEVYMTFSVNKKNRKWISKDSLLMIIKPLIGAPYIELQSVLGNPILEAGSTLDIQMSDDINDMISKLEPAVNKMISTLNNIESITSEFAKNDSSLITTINNLQTFTNKLAKNDSILTSVTGNRDSTINLIKSINLTTKIMDDIRNITSSLDKDIIKPSSSTIKDLEFIMKDITQKLQALDGTVKAVGSYDKDLIELKEQISVSLEKSNQIMDKVDALMQDTSSSKVILP
ncbi:MAG: MlaD family protein [Campylobacterota bacterium]|nr:MlaD family protein [Campylobacterota bacterium]